MGVCGGAPGAKLDGIGVGRAEGNGRTLVGPGVRLFEMRIASGLDKDRAAAGIEPGPGPIEITGRASGGDDIMAGPNDGALGSAGGGRLRADDSTKEASAFARSPRSFRRWRWGSGRSGT